VVSYITQQKDGVVTYMLDQRAAKLLYPSLRMVKTLVKQDETRKRMVFKQHLDVAEARRVLLAYARLVASGFDAVVFVGGYVKRELPISPSQPHMYLLSQRDSKDLGNMETCARGGFPMYDASERWPTAGELREALGTAPKTTIAFIAVNVMQYVGYKPVAQGMFRPGDKIFTIEHPVDDRCTTADEPG
jgi:hypothetical protein